MSPKIKRSLEQTRNFIRRTDLLLFALCLIASLFGILIISSATNSYITPMRYPITQAVAMLIGIFCYFVFTLIDVDIFADRWPVMLLIEALLLLILIPFGVEVGGNKGWLDLGIVSVQPTEIVKFIFIVLCAKHIAYLKEYRNLNSVLSIAQLVAHFGFLFMLIMIVSSDLGSALVFLFIFIVLLYAGGTRLYWFLFGGAALAVVIPLAWSNFLSDRHKERILAPYDATIDPEGYGVNWQPFLAKKAISSGRLSGQGLFGGSQTQSNYLDSQHADYIFASAGEELGFIGCVAIVLLLVCIIVRCVIVGIHARNTFGMLICFGVAASLTFQTFINVGMSIGLTPVIGITLPFFSYGGSSLVICFASAGLVSGVHYQTRADNYGSEYKYIDP